LSIALRTFRHTTISSPEFKSTIVSAQQHTAIIYLLKDGSESAVAALFRLDRVLTIINGLFISQNNTTTTHPTNQTPKTITEIHTEWKLGIQFSGSTGRCNVEHGPVLDDFENSKF